MALASKNHNLSAAVEVHDLKKTYRNGLIFGKKFEALCGVTLRVERGEVFGLLGPNGAGKTTLIKILLGIARKTGGSAALLGRPAGDRASRLKVGYLPENLRIAGHHNALTAMELYGKLSGLTSAQVRERRDQLLQSVGLADRARDSVRKYSKGMLQRLGLAQALLHDPELLILDEPTDGLDPLGRSQVRGLLNQLRQQGKTVFLNSHILQEVELVCDRVAILDRGVLRAMGTVAEIAPQQTTGVELDVVVSGAEADLRTALGDRGITALESMGDGQHRLRLRLLDQAAVDQCIDDFRSHGVSIIGLSRRRLTLEDAFLTLLGQGN
jgi:ABC-2 type transport system ATP-binding protein